VSRALKNPIGGASLRELVKGAGKVVIVADDNTRLTPTDKIIPVLLDEMNAAGMQDSQITVVIALGTHRFMTEEKSSKNSAGSCKACGHKKPRLQEQVRTGRSRHHAERDACNNKPSNI